VFKFIQITKINERRPYRSKSDVVFNVSRTKQLMIHETLILIYWHLCIFSGGSNLSWEVKRRATVQTPTFEIRHWLCDSVTSKATAGILAGNRLYHRAVLSNSRFTRLSSWF